MLSVNALRDLLFYTEWASRRLVEAASKLAPEQLTRDFGTADKSVLGTLVHCYFGDRVWLERVEGKVVTPLTDADRCLFVLQNDWPGIHQRWRQWAAGLTDEKAATILSYTDLRGNAWRQPIWQVVLHVVNHGTHHRGQVSGFLRSMGVAPPPLDLSFYYREQGIAKAAG